MVIIVAEIKGRVSVMVASLLLAPLALSAISYPPVIPWFFRGASACRLVRSSGCHSERQRGI
jgi:hypothetical protein